MESSSARGEELFRERWSAFRFCGQVLLSVYAAHYPIGI